MKLNSILKRTLYQNVFFFLLGLMTQYYISLVRQHLLKKRVKVHTAMADEAKKEVASVFNIIDTDSDTDSDAESEDEEA